jgi:hypothetical protein
MAFRAGHAKPCSRCVRLRRARMRLTLGAGTATAKRWLCPDASQGRRVAQVDGITITNDQVQKPLDTNLIKLEEQIYDIKRQAIDSMIASRLNSARGGGPQHDHDEAHG